MGQLSLLIQANFVVEVEKLIKCRKTFSDSQIMEKLKNYSIEGSGEKQMSEVVQERR